MPGFSADMSLYSSTRSYVGATADSMSAAKGVMPQFWCELGCTAKLIGACGGGIVAAIGTGGLGAAAAALGCAWALPQWDACMTRCNPAHEPTHVPLQPCPIAGQQCCAWDSNGVCVRCWPADKPCPGTGQHGGHQIP